MKSLQYVTSDRAGQFATGPCLLAGIVVQDAGANAWIVYDDTSTSNPVFKLSLAAAGSKEVIFPSPIAFTKGIYIDFTGTTGRIMVLLA